MWCGDAPCPLWIRNRQRQRALRGSCVAISDQIVPRSKRIWLEGTEKFIIAPLYPIVTIAGDCIEAFDVQNGYATPADLNKTGLLEGALDEIDGGSLDAKHLCEKFLRQPDVIAS